MHAPPLQAHSARPCLPGFHFRCSSASRFALKPNPALAQPRWIQGCLPQTATLDPCPPQYAACPAAPGAGLEHMGREQRRNPRAVARGTRDPHRAQAQHHRERDAFLRDALIGRLTAGAEQVTPGPHSWDGSYTDLRIAWKGHDWRIQSAHDGADLVLLVTPLPSKPDLRAAGRPLSSPVDFLWNRPGTTLKHGNFIEARTGARTDPDLLRLHQSADEGTNDVNVPVTGSYFAVDLVHTRRHQHRQEPHPRGNPIRHRPPARRLRAVRHHRRQERPHRRRH